MSESKSTGPEYTLVYSENFDRATQRERGELTLWEGDTFYEECLEEDPDYDMEYDENVLVTTSFPKGSQKRVYLLNDDGDIQELSIVEDSPSKKETPEEALDSLEQHAAYLTSFPDVANDQDNTLSPSYSKVLTQRLQRARRCFSPFGCTLCCVVDENGKVLADRELFPVTIEE